MIAEEDSNENIVNYVSFNPTDEQYAEYLNNSETDYNYLLTKNEITSRFNTFYARVDRDTIPNLFDFLVQVIADGYYRHMLMSYENGVLNYYIDASDESQYKRENIDTSVNGYGWDNVYSKGSIFWQIFPPWYVPDKANGLQYSSLNFANFLDPKDESYQGEGNLLENEVCVQMLLPKECVEVNFYVFLNGVWVT